MKSILLLRLIILKSSSKAVANNARPSIFSYGCQNVLISEKSINLNKHINRPKEKIISVNHKNPLRKVNILNRTPN